MWFKGDDGWHKHRKRIRTGLDLEGMAAQGLWFAAGTWCADELTDGWVPDYIVDYLAPGIGRQLAKRLEVAKLWHPEVRDGEEGWQFHEWDQHQRTREQVMTERAAAADRQATARKRANERKQAESDARHAAQLRDIRAESVPSHEGGHAVSHADRHAVTNGVSHGAVTPTRPDLTRPDQTVVPKGTTETEDQTLFPLAPRDGADATPRKSTTQRNADDPLFGEFYNAYPRKKEPTAARKAWDKAIRTTDPQLIIAAARRLAAEGRDPQYTPYPASWLNAGGFADQPDPDRPVARGGFDARAADFDQMRDRLRDQRSPAAALIRSDPPALTQGDPDA